MDVLRPWGAASIPHCVQFSSSLGFIHISVDVWKARHWRSQFQEILGTCRPCRPQQSLEQLTADPTGLCSRGRALGKTSRVWSLTVKLLLAILHKSVIDYRKGSQNRLGVGPEVGKMVAETCLR